MSTTAAVGTQATYLGIDLAWGTTNLTGLAALDAHGALVASTSLRSDAEIDEFIERWRAGRVVAAIDAPIIVPNETGKRECERAVTAEFGRFHAGAHASNRSRPMFDPPRALELSRRHGWDVDPTSRDLASDVAIEVYPHPAMVVLFDLDRVIPYKRKPGRTVASCRDATLRLMDLMKSELPELRLGGSERWGAIRDAVGAATRPVHLAAVEDEIDAIFCAHLAWLWGTGAAPMRVIGDVNEGYIVVPGEAPETTVGRASGADAVTDLADVMRRSVPSLTAEQVAAVTAVARSRGAE